MLIVGPSSSDKIQVVTDATADVEVSYSWISVNTAAPPVVQDTDGDALASITSATTTDVLVGAASTKKRLGFTSIRNNHASTTVNVTVQHTNGTDTAIIVKVQLLAGEALHFNGASTWLHYDSNGGLYPSVGNAATQAEMEAGTANNKYVTPKGVNWHPGVAKFWVKAGVTGNVLASWNVTSLTDNGTGDITVNIGTDFSSVNWCAQVAVEMTATTYAVANARTAHVRSGGQAAGTVRCDCIDGTATTQLVKDPTFWHIGGWGDQ